MSVITQKQLTAEIVQTWLVARLATVLDIPAAEIDIDAPLIAMG